MHTIEIYASDNPNGYVPAPFSRAGYYLVYLNGEKINVISNPYKNYQGSVSKRVIAMLMSYSPDVVYAIDFGPKAQYWLSQNRIRFEVRT